jgi:hypothetical protein
MNRPKRKTATIRLIKRWPEPPSRLAAQLRLRRTTPSQALSRRLAA